MHLNIKICYILIFLFFKKIPKLVRHFDRVAWLADTQTDRENYLYPLQIKPESNTFPHPPNYPPKHILPQMRHVYLKRLSTSSISPTSSELL